ncbi:50S ribosomal protein L24 [Candidatus Kaiserbacteria bacterium RIFCSPHIGHO2_01_FULL_50_13]|uniref:Large ribosomal subunit protein uL24 n=1 Tax=Candidatus Kaiserbacteria bacterium RIFCSPLOWO2_01_FULL_50_24 TaxID=1798507 RepID=A0A1F6EIF8_9BACT|nr:MAG: 50S ribosomal protein L24 [Candidatus Kaiserbacteria bacterium RIFCSPHIGHO2_01_FULL_50_13]OGG73423.1 MAG: 50S ribosomal protein L24 [Candidatus Kaiserbacteria bacterium RIFCSPLOWO2_01_FULL_50_24]OGG81306.1 MAG: 50S ribosomal protein L24 [Candidatus Kaiserbacteria bacterium RIFCSPLOWO2_02_FULL_51_13]
MRIKKGDKVIVTAGKDRGHTSTVIRVLPRKDLVVVEGVNVVKKHQRRTAKSRKGQIVSRPMPVHISNIMIIDPKSGKPTRIKIVRGEDGMRKRVAAKSGQELK